MTAYVIPSMIPFFFPYIDQVSLELGGNAPCIIFDDADIEVAVKGTVRFETICHALATLLSSRCL
jgi:hypothetical protein